MKGHTLSLLVVAAGLLIHEPVYAQKEPCFILCDPQFTFAPESFTRNWFDPPRVRLLPSGEEMELETETDLLLVFSISAKTMIPRTSIFAVMQWTPFEDNGENPFTGFTAEDLGEDEVTRNEPSLEFGVTFDLIPRKQTNGWFSLALDVLDQFGPAAEPDDERSYTHKLQFEPTANFALFNWLPKRHYLHNVLAFATLEYTATGLPDEGDEVPKGKRVFLDDADPWAVFFGLKFPIAPPFPD